MNVSIPEVLQNSENVNLEDIIPPRFYPFNRIKPDKITGNGVKYWTDKIDKSKNIEIYFIEFPNKYRCRVIVENGKVVHETVGTVNIALESLLK